MPPGAQQQAQRSPMIPGDGDHQDQPRRQHLPFGEKAFQLVAERSLVRGHYFHRVIVLSCWEHECREEKANNMPKREFRLPAAPRAHGCLFCGTRRQWPWSWPALFSTCMLPKDITISPRAEKRQGSTASHGSPAGRHAIREVVHARPLLPAAPKSRSIMRDVRYPHRLHAPTAHLSCSMAGPPQSPFRSPR